MRKSYQSLAMELINEYGIDLKVSYFNGLDLDAWAPKGKVFSASECHTLVTSGEHGESEASLWKDMYERLSMGLEDCRTADCDCHDAE